MVRPRAFAVLRLMISSNLVGCSTGRSAGLAALQDLVDIGRRAAPDIVVVRTVRHQAADLDKSPQLVHGREPVLRSQIHDPLGVYEEGHRSKHEQSARARPPPS
jgi:hypothetical protein